MIHNILLYGGSIAIAGMFVVVLNTFEGYLPKGSPSDWPRTKTEFCQEVAYEVRLSVEAGLLSDEQADQIIDRCHSTETEYFNG